MTLPDGWVACIERGRLAEVWQPPLDLVRTSESKFSRESSARRLRIMVLDTRHLRPLLRLISAQRGAER